MLNTLKNLLVDALQQVGLNPHRDALGIKPASMPKYGDYQIDGLINIAKQAQLLPLALAQQVAPLLVGKIVKSATVAGPGFINLLLQDEFIVQQLKEAFQFVPEPLVVVIDYSSPNLAKEMHVGHLRSTIIGDALVRLHEYLGHRVIRRNHVGDWGTQFGMLIAHYLDSPPHENLELENLEQLYREAKKHFDADPLFAERARQYVVALQKKDPAIYPLWQRFVHLSLTHCQQLYDRLQVRLRPKDAVGESAYNDALPRIVNDLLTKNIATLNQGAICVFFETEELNGSEVAPFIIQKQDGGYSYATTDIAAAYDRIDNLKANQLIYVVDIRQTLHFKQLFATLKKARKDCPIKLQHVPFGVVLGEDNKPFKTRDGGTVKLVTLLDEAKKRTIQLLQQRQTQTEESLSTLAEKLSIAALKYADLAKHRSSDYLFSYDRMLSFEGNTALYLLYAVVRIKSLFRKLSLPTEDGKNFPVIFTHPLERSLALQITKFQDLILQTVEEATPHLLCGYLYNLAGSFMRFYEQCPIITETTQTIQHSRVALTAFTLHYLILGLNLLGIQAVEYM